MFASLLVDKFVMPAQRQLSASDEVSVRRRIEQRLGQGIQWLFSRFAGYWSDQCQRVRTGSSIG
jgi:hypothetical protein